MRVLLILFALAFAYLFYDQLAEEAAPEQVAATQPASAPDAQRLNEEAARRRESAAKAAERARMAKPAIEAALAELSAKGVTRDNVKAYFYDEMEVEVCENRECSDQ